MPQKFNNVALSAIGIGSIFIWSGIKGWAVLPTIGDIITGKQPKQSEINLLANPYASSNQGGTGFNTTPSVIANTFLQYQGHAYIFGGAPGKDGSRPWDCSSAINWVVGTKLGGAIPGYGPGQYDGSAHGPPTGSWGIWPGLKHISVAEVQAGDFIVWTGHMGIAVDNTHMISALNSRLGTLVTPIAGNGNGPLMCYGRYLG